MLRLDRWLVTLGIGSRSEVQKLVKKGGVKVNNAPVKDPGMQVDENTATLTVGGAPVDGRLTRHVMLHKPAGLLTAARDKKQPTVMDLLPEVYSAIGCMPVGRLDKDTTGLLFLTTDGELNHRLLSPGRHVDKTYLAEVDGVLDDSHVAAFAAGLHLSDFDAQPAKLEIIAPQMGRVTVHEGKFHQIKRMFEAVGNKIVGLERVSFGGIPLDESLERGEFRPLTDEEESHLRRAAGEQVP